MAAGWSELPQELLTSIGNRVDNEIDVLRFRSVCASWRSSIPPSKECHSLPLHSPFPITPNPQIHHPYLHGFFSLTRITVYRLEPLQNPSSPPKAWLIKVGETPQRGKMLLLNPVWSIEIEPLPPTFPRVVNFSNFRISEICHAYSGDLSPTFVPSDCEEEDNKPVYLQKAVFLSDSEVVVMCRCGDLAVMRLRDEKWTPLVDYRVNRGNEYRDILNFNGQVYVVDIRGCCAVVDSSFNLTEIASPLNHSSGTLKYLVESMGELILVDIKHDFPEQEQPGSFIRVIATCDMIVSLRVYKLNEEEHRWDEVTNLGDRILVVSSDCCCSVSANDFEGSKGKCILFKDQFRVERYPDEYNVLNSDLFKPGVFNLEDSSVGPLVRYPRYGKIFWPPSGWLVPNSSSAQS